MNNIRKHFDELVRDFGDALVFDEKETPSELAPEMGAIARRLAQLEEEVRKLAAQTQAVQQSHQTFTD